MKHKLLRLTLMGIALSAFIVGWVGVFLPGLPTTVFWLLAAYCAGKTNPAFQQWIYQRGTMGAMAESLVERRSLPRNGKRSALLGLWGMLTLSFVITLFIGGSVWLAAALPLIGACVTVFILKGIQTAPLPSAAETADRSLPPKILVSIDSISETSRDAEASESQPPYRHAA